MPSKSNSNQVLFLYEGGFGGEIDEAITAGFTQNGYHVTCQLRGKPWDPEYNLVVGYGPFTYQQGHLQTVARQVLALPPKDRPLLIWWLTENPAPSWIPPNIGLGAAKLRLWLDDQFNGLEASTKQRLMGAHRLRVLGQLHWAKQQGALGILVVTNHARADYYRAHGFDPVVAPLGYHRSYGTDLGLGREIDVAFMGQLMGKRRQRILPPLFAELQRRNISVAAVEGVYGETRTRFLNRSRILLSVLRAPQDFVGQRIMLGAANRAMVISEPMLNPDPFVPDRHFCVVPVVALADTIDHALQNLDGFQPIMNEAYRLVTEDLTCAKMVQRVLKRVKAMRSQNL